MAAQNEAVSASTQRSPLPNVADYFTDKTVLLTGATGFLGKVFLEKLLRSCPGVKRVYCLIRPKNGMVGEDRLQQLFTEKLFETLHELQAGFTEKVQAVHGDILEDQLGMHDDVYETLQENVDIIVHSAGSAKHNEHFRLAMELNVLGVRRLIKLAKTIKNLKVFLHVSSAYANCDRSHIEERVYPSHVDYQKVAAILDWMDDDMLSTAAQSLIGKKPNTFTLTKHMAEVLLLEEGQGLNTVIIRPSIITATWKEPIPGWVDTWNGLTEIYVATGKGILRTLKAESDRVADLIPVDLPANLMIAAVWYTGVTRPNATYVYHMTSGGYNPFTWGEMEDVVVNAFKRIPLDSCFRRPKRHITTNSWLHDYWMFVSHIIPAYLADFGYAVIGEKPKMVSTYRKLHEAMKMMEFFGEREWDWTHNNTDTLCSLMSAEDQKVFYIDPRGLHWPTYIENYCLGTKKFLLKEDLAGLPAARAHLRRLRNIRYVFNTFLLVVFWRLLVARSSLARNSWYFILGLVSKFVRFFRLSSTLPISTG